MEFGLTQESNLEQDRTNTITILSQELKLFFAEKNYGQDVESFLIGIICVKPEFEDFFKPRKPKYIESKIEAHDGISVDIKKSYGYDIKIDYEKFSSISNEEISRLLAAQILKSVTQLETLPKKIRDFDKNRFESDLKNFFKERDLL